MKFDKDKIKNFLFGLPRNPFKADTRKNIALIAFIAWIGLGADGLSSSAYGPEEAFLALGTHTYLGLYLAVATTFTVFIISAAYNQVIELFPNGGGGYKVATSLLGKYAGLVSGAALIIDYTMTIAISTASGVDALFSLLPVGILKYKLITEIAVLCLLTLLNLRGMKESIKILMPIFLGFLVTHFALITYGIWIHRGDMPYIIQNTIATTHQTTEVLGWTVLLSLFLRAYSLGGGTYTGLEAVSNNVHMLAEPRVRTGKWTMFYMAVSLSLTASGIIFLYLLLHAQATYGQTLNAVAFGNLLQHIPYGNLILIITLAFEAGLLFLAANTGFLGGPAVLANMSLDSWVPSRFRNLSNRLVIQNGIILFGIAAILILLWTHGKVSLLVVLYSMNVFLTFSLALLGLCVYWSKHRNNGRPWKRRLFLSMLGFGVCASILIVTVLEKFTEGGWLTILITSTTIGLCLLVNRYYKRVKLQVLKLDKLLTVPLKNITVPKIDLDPKQPTAVFFITEGIGAGMHTLLWVKRMFPGYFKNYVFLSAGHVEVGSYGSDELLEKMQEHVRDKLEYFTAYCEEHEIAATQYAAYGTDVIDELVKLVDKVTDKFTSPIFFTSRYIYKDENALTRWLHSETALTLQSHLHAKAMQMIILPVKL